MIELSKSSSRDDYIRIGLIGAGNFAKSILLPAIQKVEGFELIGICTTTGVSAHSLGKKYNTLYTYLKKINLLIFAFFIFSIIALICYYKKKSKNEKI